MRSGRAEQMRAYWDERARTNAAWYVDTSLDFDTPDMERFFAGGRQIVDDHYVAGLARPATTQLAVEIGSGLGRVCVALRRDFDRVVGIDISPEMVQRARELTPDEGIEFLVGDGVSLRPIPDGSADLVFTFTVFQHIPDRKIVEGYIAEAARVLRPGGVFAFQWNNQPHPVAWGLRRTVLSTLQRSGARPERYERHAPEFLGCRISRRHIARAVEDAGLTLSGMRGAGTLWAWAWAVRP